MPKANLPALLVAVREGRFHGSWYAFEKELAAEGIGASTLDTWRKGSHRLRAAHLDALVHVTGYPPQFWHGLGPTSTNPGFTAEELVVEWDAYLTQRADRHRAFGAAWEQRKRELAEIERAGLRLAFVARRRPGVYGRLLRSRGFWW